MSEITVILNGYKRPQFLKEQINAIENQTIKPKEIMLWQNNSEGFENIVPNNIITAVSNKNLGVWARFSYALNAKTEYICIFDDDTIPGSKWFENCLDLFIRPQIVIILTRDMGGITLMKKLFELILSVIVGFLKENG